MGIAGVPDIPSHRFPQPAPGRTQPLFPLGDSGRTQELFQELLAGNSGETCPGTAGTFAAAALGSWLSFLGHQSVLCPQLTLGRADGALSTALGQGLSNPGRGRSREQTNNAKRGGYPIPVPAPVEKALL